MLDSITRESKSILAPSKAQRAILHQVVLVKNFSSGLDWKLELTLGSAPTKRDAKFKHEEEIIWAKTKFNRLYLKPLKCLNPVIKTTLMSRLIVFI